MSYAIALLHYFEGPQVGQTIPVHNPLGGLNLDWMQLELDEHGRATRSIIREFRTCEEAEAAIQAQEWPGFHYGVAKWEEGVWTLVLDCGECREF